MPDSTFRPQPSARFIPGVYNYCDSWCERCVFSARCRVFQMRSVFEQTIGTDEERDAAARRILEEGGKADVRVPESQRRDFEELLERANRPLTAEDETRIGEMLDRRRHWVHAHALHLAGRDYSEASLQIVEGIRGTIGAADDVTRTALETIERFAWLIAAKVGRALGGLADVTLDDDDGDGDEENVMSDANGSAKIVQLAIAESRDAWSVVREIQAGGIDDQAEAMIRRLSDLDAAVAVAFPGAASFRRPGFDD